MGSRLIHPQDAHKDWGDSWEVGASGSPGGSELGLGVGKQPGDPWGSLTQTRAKGGQRGQTHGSWGSQSP